MVNVTASGGDGRLRLSLLGELDHHSARDGMTRIGRALDDYMPRECVIDMSGLSFMDSSGIALILRVYRRMRECGGRLLIEAPQNQPRRVLDASGIDRVVKIQDTVKGADK